MLAINRFGTHSRREQLVCWGLSLVLACMLQACGGASSKEEAESPVSAFSVRALSATGGSDAASATATATASANAVQGESTYTEASKLIRGDESLVALGNEMFGDRVDLYSGGLEFVQNDVNVPGNSSLSVAVGRRHSAPASLGSPGIGNLTAGHFGDWELEIPRLQGVFAALTEPWTVGVGRKLNGLLRCSLFGPPPAIAQLTANPIQATFNPDEYWHGSSLYVPGQGSQEILIRNPKTTSPTSGSYPLVTKNLWVFSCLSSLARGNGEGFLALAPDGTRYQFDWMVSRPYASLVKGSPEPARNPSVPVDSQKVGTPADVFVDGFILRRTEVWILPTKITDRHGNTVVYTYSNTNPWQLLRIEGNDATNSPRVVTFQYDGSSSRITAVTQGARTWRYGYRSTDGGYVLSTVTLPDQRVWTFNMDGLTYGPSLVAAGSAHCRGWNELNTEPRTGSMTSPSGATGTFVIAATRHGRSDVLYECRNDDGTGQGTVVYPIYIDRFSLTSKSIAGPGMTGSNTWSYSYGDAIRDNNASFSPCNGCAVTKQTTVRSPEGNVTRYTFGNRFRKTEGQLVSTEEGSVGGEVLRTTVREYRSPDAGPYPDPIGYSTQRRGNGELAARHTPEDHRYIEQKGDVFDNLTIDFDTYARPTLKRRSSSLGYSLTELTAYHHNLSLWVLGQVASVTDAGNGKVIEATAYTPDKAMPESRSSFGRKLATFTYWSDGTLKRRGDSLDQFTNFSNYKRGLARSVTFADSSSESAVVDDYGSILSVTNAAATTTQYAYDDLSRLISIQPPEGNATTLLYEQVWQAEYGLDPGHWRQTVTAGDARTVRLFDAQWRPLMTRIWDQKDPNGTRRVTQQRFDRDGRATFESYPQRDSSDVRADAPGTTKAYDALGRIVLESRSSELGPLNTVTQYASGFKRRTTSPRDKVTVEQFRALDDPADFTLRHADLPEGVSVDIWPDRYGKALSLTRSGAGKSVTRHYVYDPQERLCKTIEPESAVTVQVYVGGSTNVAWKASGQALLDTSSCELDSVPNSARISYGYDLRNRLKSTSYGDNSPPVYRNYTPDGLLSQISSDRFIWDYDYSSRRLLKEEKQTRPDGIWIFKWTRDGNGNIAALVDPWGSIDYAPNALGEPTQVSGYASNVTHHPNGMVADYTLNNGISHSLKLNLRNLPESIQEGAVINDRYSYDPNGNVLQILDQLPGAASTRNMTYDGLDRLTEANGTWGSGRYAYDALDNMVSSTVGSRVLTHQVNPTTNRLDALTGTQSVNIGYDVNGNVTSRNDQSFVFDIGNRLRSAPGKATYFYDGHGRRTFTVYANNDVRIEAYTMDGKMRYAYVRSGWASRHVYLGNHLIAERFEDGSTNYLHTDALGSPVARTDTAGNLVSWTRYEPYGATAKGTSPKMIGFTGHVNDVDTGLVYMQQRYYDPLAGRFLSVDPVTTDANTGSAFGRYHYANNNPYAFTDPTGMEPECSDSCMKMRAVSDAHSLGQSTTAAGSSMGSGSSSSGGPGLRVSLAGASNFAAGVGDTLTFGATAQVRDSLDIGSVDSSSTAYGAGQATGVGVGVATGAAGLRAVAGPLKQWVRIGPSYSKAAGSQVDMSIRWGASPAGGGKYLQQIPSQTMRDFNQWLRAQRLPVGGWRAADPGHFHLW